MSRHRKKSLLLLMVGIALLVLVPPIFLLVRTAFRDRAVVEKPPVGYADDVSRLNKTQVAEVWDIPSDPQKGEDQLRDLLLKAQASHLQVSIAGARHSMGDRRSIREA